MTPDWMDLIPEKLTRRRKARKRVLSAWRDRKTARHVTQGGAGIVGRLNKRKGRKP